MPFSFCWIVIAALVAIATGAYDEHFCKKNIGEIDDADTSGPKPTFYDNFYVFVEAKSTRTPKSSSYEEVYYCQGAGLEYGTLREEGNQIQVWVDANSNEIMEADIGLQVCINSLPKGMITDKLLGVLVDKYGNISLNRPEIALGWDRKLQKAIKYQGSGFARGISTLLWRICTYDEETDITAYSEWYIVDPTEITLPAVKRNQVTLPYLPVLVIVKAINHTDTNATEYRDRLDLTFFDSVQPDDKVFQIPIMKLCSAKPSAQFPLPTAKTYFKFKGEQITIVNAKSQSSFPPDILYTVEEYTQLSQLFIQDSVSSQSPNNGNDKSYLRTINDYSTGLSFRMDLSSGSCTVDVIPPEGVDSINAAGGHAVMRTSQQFFDLDSDQYQYMGIYTKRGIECDTWSAYFVDGKSDHEQNTLYTWYFANANWMANNGFDKTSPFPVTLELQEDSTFTQFNFYEFDTQDQMTFPDVSLCFNPNSTLNVEFLISASYVQVVAPDIRAFNRGVYTALVKLTSLRSLLRISDLDVQPGSSNFIIVRFKLLEIASVQGQGNVQQHDASNHQIYTDLYQAANAGTFSIDISSIDDTTGKRTVYAMPHSVGTFSDGTFIPAKPNTTPPGSYTISSGSSGYSAGAMAGIGIGMLLVGIILGIVAIFGFKKFRQGGSGSDISMKKLGEESKS